MRDRLLPTGDRAAGDFVESFDLSEYATDFEIRPGSPLVGKTVPDSWLGEKDDIRVLEVFRDDKSFEYPAPGIEMQGGDVVRIRGPAEVIRDIEGRPHLQIRTFAEDEHLEARDEEIEFVEALIAPNQSLDGQSLREADLPPEFPGKVLAIRR
ncbi:MAG: TrkA C-terminal domain-containing protein [Bradymonadaceae bacterium]